MSKVVHVEIYADDTEPEVDPKTAILGIGWSAYFKDTEGTFGVYKNDTTAA